MSLGNYKIAAIISSVVFILLLMFDSYLYDNTMQFSLLIPLLVTHVYYFDSLRKEKRRITYLLFITAFIACFFISLPEVTYEQAKQKAIDTYEITIIAEEKIMITNDDWNPVSSSRAYCFTGHTKEEEKISIMVVPSSGDVIKLLD